MISFVICTNGKKVDKTKLLIKSIFNTAGKDADIHLGGVIEPFKDMNIHLYDFSHEANNGLVGELRNKTIDKAPGDIIIYSDDDTFYPENFYEKFLEFDKNNDWEIMTTRIMLPNGGRYWDRAIVDDDTHTLVSYSHDINDIRLFICATFFAVKKDLFNREKFNPDLKYYAGHTDKNMPVAAWRLAEDLEYSRRLNEQGIRIKFDDNNMIFHFAEDFSEYYRFFGVDRYKRITLLNGNVKTEQPGTVINRSKIIDYFNSQLRVLGVDYTYIPMIGMNIQMGFENEIQNIIDEVIL